MFVDGCGGREGSHLFDFGDNAADGRKVVECNNTVVEKSDSDKDSEIGISRCIIEDKEVALERSDTSTKDDNEYDISDDKLSIGQDGLVAIDEGYRNNCHDDPV